MSLTKKATSVTTTLVVARAVNRLGGFSMGFLGVRLAADLGVPLPIVGSVLAVFGACTIPSRILGGWLANQVGARRAMLVGLVASASAQLVIAVGTTATAVIAGAVVLGLAYEIIEPATQAIVAEAVPPHVRASSYSLLWASMAVAGVAAGVLAALVTRWGIAALFLVDALTSLAAAVLVAALLPDAYSRATPRPWRSALSRRLLAWTLLGSVYATVVMIVVFMLPLTVQRAGLPPSLTGWLLAASAAAAIGGHRLLVRWEQRIAPTAMLVAGYLVLSVALGLWAWGTTPALVAGALLEGASGCFLLGTQQAVASRMSTPGTEATVMTVYGLSWGVGTVIAPLAGSRLLHAGPTTLWGACATVSLALAAGLLLHHRLGARPAARPADERAAGSGVLGAEELAEVRDRERHGAALGGVDEALLDQPVAGG